MKRRIGISLYPDHSIMAEDYAYIDKAAALGYSRVFMSMLEVTEGKAAVAKKFSEVIRYARIQGFEVILDIAPTIFEQLAISYDDLTFFAMLGADGIRLDMGFDGSKEALLSYNPEGLVIELNMSNDVAYVNNIMTYQPNKPFLYGCHNFYPQRGSALPFDFFMKCNQRFKKLGLRTAAFITSQTATIGPWDINDGLPTLEIHRDLPIEVQAKHLFATEMIDDVIIGNAYASNEELAAVAAVNRYQIELEVSFVDAINPVEENIITEPQHYRRGDITARMVRSTNVRKIYSASDNPAHDHNEMFERGDIVIGNNQFGKYKNELQIVLEAHVDDRKNKVATVRAEEMLLLSFIGPWRKFKLRKK